MTNDTSRPSASGTTERTGPEEAGRPATTPDSWLATVLQPSTQNPTSARAGDFEDMLRQVYPDYRIVDFTGSRGRLRAWREETKFMLWELRSKVRHAFGFHTMIPVEEWDPDAGSIVFIGERCWLCP